MIGYEDMPPINSDYRVGEMVRYQGKWCFIDESRWFDGPGLGWLLGLRLNLIDPPTFVWEWQLDSERNRQ